MELFNITQQTKPINRTIVSECLEWILIMLAELLTLDFGKENVFTNVPLEFLAKPIVEPNESIDEVINVDSADVESDVDTSELDEIAKAIKQIKEESEGFMSFAYNHNLVVPQDTEIDYGELWNYKSNVLVTYSDVVYNNGSDDDEDSDLRYDSGVVMKIQENRKMANYILGAAHNVMSSVTGINTDDGISITQKEKHDLNRYTSYFFMLNIIAYETAF